MKCRTLRTNSHAHQLRTPPPGGGFSRHVLHASQKTPNPRCQIPEGAASKRTQAYPCSPPARGRPEEDGALAGPCWAPTCLKSITRLGQLTAAHETRLTRRGSHDM